MPEPSPMRSLRKQLKTQKNKALSRVTARDANKTSAPSSSSRNITARGYFENQEKCRQAKKIIITRGFGESQSSCDSQQPRGPISLNLRWFVLTSR